MPGQLCNFDDPPAARDSNRMCEARRILKIFIREGKGEEALHLLDPFIARILSYVVGTGAGTAHYEAAQVVGATCTKAYCRIEDTIDVLVGLLAFLESTFEEPHRAQDVLTLLRDLYAHPGMAALVERAQQINEADLVTTSNMLVENVANLPTDPSAFRRDYLMNLEVKLNDLLQSTSWNNAPYIGLRALLDQVIGPHTPSDTTSPYAKTPLLLDLFDPSRPYPVLQPLQAVIACLNNLNTQEHLDGIAAGVKLVFALGPQSNTGTNAIALADVLGALEGLTEIDDRDSLITFGRRALVMIRDDEEGTTAARKVCAKALDDRAPADGGVPNAELVMPVLQSVFEGGALSELFCLIDTLLYGCASGPQPACPSGSTSP